ncbi:large subunit ribosomal protein MRP49, partial [Tremellales sp. Uapishka_1]
MPAQAIRRLPLRQAVDSLKSGVGAIKLDPSVSALSIRFLAHNTESGPRDFVQTIAPRIAYSNPTLPMHIHRIADRRTKSKNPKGRDSLARDGEQEEDTKPVMVVDFHQQPTQTLPLAHLSASTILKQLIAVAGEDKLLAVDAPEAVVAERISPKDVDMGESVQPVM